MNVSNKVRSTGLAGAILTMLMGIYSMTGAPELSPALVAALGTVLSAIVGYFVPETNPSPSARQAMETTS